MPLDHLYTTIIIIIVMHKATSGHIGCDAVARMNPRSSPHATTTTDRLGQAFFI